MTETQAASKVGIVTVVADPTSINVTETDALTSTITATVKNSASTSAPLGGKEVTWALVGDYATGTTISPTTGTTSATEDDTLGTTTATLTVGADETSKEITVKATCDGVEGTTKVAVTGIVEAIPSIAVTGLTQPVTDGVVASNKATVANTANYTVGDTTWTVADGTVGATFESGKVYTAKFTLTAKEGFKFTDATTKPTITGGNVTFGTITEENKNSVEVTVVFAETAAAPTVEITGTGYDITDPTESANGVIKAAESDGTAITTDTTIADFVGSLTIKPDGAVVTVDGKASTSTDKIATSAGDVELKVYAAGTTDTTGATPLATYTVKVTEAEPVNGGGGN